jgi:hypothetical protein
VSFSSQNEFGLSEGKSAQVSKTVSAAPHEAWAATHMPDPEDNSGRQQSLPMLVLEHFLLDHREQLVRQVFHLAVDLRHQSFSSNQTNSRTQFYRQGEQLTLSLTWILAGSMSKANTSLNRGRG